MQQESGPAQQRHRGREEPGFLRSWSGTTWRNHHPGPSASPPKCLSTNALVIRSQPFGALDGPKSTGMNWDLLSLLASAVPRLLSQKHEKQSLTTTCAPQEFPQGYSQ